MESPRVQTRNVLLIAVMLAAVALGCGRARPAIPPNYAAVDIAVSPISLNQRIASDAMSERICELIYSSLLRLDHKGNWAGDLASSFERPTPLTVIFHLRHGLHFSDGRFLTARDVVFTYASVLGPKTLSVKRAGLAELESITAPDDYTVVMATRRPYAPAFEMARLGIVPTDSMPPSRDVESTPSGSGSFKLLSFSRDERVMLARNRWHAAPQGAIDGISFKVVPGRDRAGARARRRGRGFAENDAVQLDLIPWLAARANLVIGRSGGTAYQYIIFNFPDPRPRDINVRRAIAYAIDRACDAEGRRAAC